MIVGIYRAVPGRWQREPGGKCGVSLLWSWVLKTWWEQSRSQFGCCFSTRGTHGGPQAFPQTIFSLLRPGLAVVHHDSQWQGPPGTFLSYPPLPASSLHTSHASYEDEADLSLRSEGQRATTARSQAIPKGDQEWSLTSQTGIWKDQRPSAGYFKSPSMEKPLSFGISYNLSR